MIAVIDYGMGNLGSVSKALESLGGKVKVTQRGSDLEKADKIVLPGVGAFQDAVNALTEMRLLAPLKHAISSNKIYLGICLGLELLFEKSVEGGACKGLGVLKGEVAKFKSDGLKVPHIGWNQIGIKKDNCPLLKGINNDTFFYFVHSYYVRPEEQGIVTALTDYGGEFTPLDSILLDSKHLTGQEHLTGFTSMVWKDNLYAVQFHPEKSQAAGLKFLENFIRL